MKKLALILFACLLSLPTLALEDSYKGPQQPIVLGAKDLMIRITTIEEFLKYVDLERVYISSVDGGSPGLFMAVPKNAIPVGTPEGVNVADQKFIDNPNLLVDSIGYYFKSFTKLAADGDFNKLAPAESGNVGGPYTCLWDDKFDKAEIDVKAINSKVFKSATSPREKILALANGLRFTTLDPNGIGEVQANCNRRGGLLPVFVAMAIPVQTFVIFRNYKPGDLESKKADAIDVYGPMFGGNLEGHYVWERSQDSVNGTVTNSEVLINLYKELGYNYTKY